MGLFERIRLLSAKNSLPHAVIFEGERAKEFSDFFAKTSVCEGENKPCGICRHCIKAEKGVHPDIIQLEPVGVSKNYKVDFVRNIKSDAFVLPNEAEIKVYIFNEADNISEISQNALLKVIEEPPKSVIFIINCKEKSNLLDTIISRATIFRCDKDENEELDEESFEIINTAIQKSEYDFLSLLYNYSKEKQEFIRICDELVFSLRILYRAKIQNKDLGENKQLLEKLTLNRILNAIEILNDTKKSLLQNKAVKIVTARTCIKLKNALGR
ncbi:MAG: hypothetical protein IJO19_01365 [Clostridia bacterium]|nr:hypothetical protein [Clostridia bacterium]